MTDISNPAPSVPPTDTAGTGGAPAAADSVNPSSGVDVTAAVPAGEAIPVPVVEPVAVPVVEPVAVPVLEPVAVPVVEPVAVPVVEPVAVPDVFAPVVEVVEVVEVVDFSAQFLSAPTHTGHSA